MPDRHRNTAPFRRMLALVPIFLAGSAPSPSPAADDPLAVDLPLVFEADFEDGGLDSWEFTDPDAWRIAEHDGDKVLELHAASRYEPKVRSPLNIALAPGVEVGDFVLDVEVRSTGRDYGHRDLCVFFGHQDPSHFYYVHLAKAADPHANSIFLVDDAPRVTIAETRTDGTPWTDAWHRVRIERRAESGMIQVFFDDMSAPAMTAHDRTFAQGRIGFGSFDDTGRFDDIQIRGRRAVEKSE